MNIEKIPDINKATNIFERKKSLLSLFSIITGCCIALLFLKINTHGEKTNFEDASTFGADTTSVMERVDGYKIHCFDSRDAAECLAGARARNAANSVLWLGNSQVHAVNQFHAGETNAAPILFTKLKEKGLDLVTFSQPNANLQEHLVLFEYIQRQLPIKLLILPVVFDDMREDGIRKEVADFISDESTKMALVKTSSGEQIINIAEATAKNSDTDTAGISQTIQEKVERTLTMWLTDRSQLWSARPEIRGQIMFNLYFLRNTFLGIKPTSKRKVIPARYLDNMAALKAILDSASNKKITVLLYVVPLRNDVEMPYFKKEYEQYKADVKILSEQYEANFVNLENLVPARLWGSKESTSVGGGQELDFMHFQAEGHKLLAAKLSELVTVAWVRRELSQ